MIIIDPENWYRKKHFDFFKNMEFPYSLYMIARFLYKSNLSKKHHFFVYFSFFFTYNAVIQYFKYPYFVFFALFSSTFDKKKLFNLFYFKNILQILLTNNIICIRIKLSKGDVKK